MKKRRRSLRLVLERGPGDGLEVTILFPRFMEIGAPDRLEVKTPPGRLVAYALDRVERTASAARRAVYRPEEG